MNISEDYLKNSILSMYKDFILGNIENIDEMYDILNSHPSITDETRNEIYKKIDSINIFNKTEDLICYTDGSVRTSGTKPKVVTSAAAGYAINYNNKEILKHSFHIPLSYQVLTKIQATTPQFAEYQGILSLVRAIKSYHPNPQIVNVTVYCDAKIVCEQLNDEYRTKHIILSDFKNKIIQESKVFKDFKVINIPREQNKIVNYICQLTSKQ